MTERVEFYEHAQQGFLNDTRAEVHDVASAADAWAKTLAFFRRELKG